MKSAWTRRFVSVINRVTRTAGLRSTHPEPRRFVVPDHLSDTIHYRGDILFDVPLRLCRYPYGFRYGGAGWHPFVDTLREYRARGGELRYEDSLLCRFYASFQPTTSLELFFPPDVASRHQNSALAEYPLNAYAPILPWNGEIYRARGEAPLAVEHGHQGFGPVTETKGRLEFSRLVNTYDSIARTGFRPEESGGIRGYFLTRGTEVVFVIRTGFHRCAALSALDHEHVRVGFAEDMIRSLCAETHARWPLVRTGPFSEELAGQFIDEFFRAESWHERGLADAVRGTAPDL
jgi:hypothetical protein